MTYIKNNYEQKLNLSHQIKLGMFLIKTLIRQALTPSLRIKKAIDSVKNSQKLKSENFTDKPETYP